MISIIVTAYNRERYLEKAISSVLNQTYNNFRLLIWDDGSTDSSLKIAQNFEVNDDRIQVIAAAHEGASKAMRNAVAKAIALYEPKYIGWVDSDDWLHPQALELLTPILENSSKLNVVYSDYMAVDLNGEKLGFSCSVTVPYSPGRMLVDLISHHFRLIRTDAYEQVGGIDPSFTYDFDYDLCLRLSELEQDTASMQRFPMVLYHRLMHADSMTGAHRAEQIEYAKIAVEKALIRRNLNNGTSVSINPVSGRIQLHF